MRDNSGTVASNNTLSSNSFGGYITGSNLSLQGNTTANNSQHGVLVIGASAFNNPLLSNSISGNGGFGIRLLSGGNGNQKALYVAASTLDGGNLTVIGGLTGAAANTTYLIQLFSNPSGPAVQAQGATFLQNVTLVTDATGNGTFNETSSQGSVVAGELISATGTLNGTTPTNTSQFSAGSNVT